MITVFSISPLGGETFLLVPEKGGKKTKKKIKSTVKWLKRHGYTGIVVRREVD